MVEEINTKLNKLSISDNKSNSQILNKVGYIYDSFMLNHTTPNGSDHVERPARISSIYDNMINFIEKDKLQDNLIQIPSSKIKKEILEKYISKDYLEELQNEDTESPYDCDTYFNKFTYDAALLASGCLLNCCDSVLKEKKYSSAFAITRPPGHHSNNKSHSGFCYLNNVYLAARYSIDVLKLKKVAIVDWDVHYGDGTYELLKSDPHILFISLHKYENGRFYPGNGHKTNIGEENGKYLKLNIPWNTNTHSQISQNTKITDDEYYYAFKILVIPMLKEFNPELILVSSGFDAAENDPLGGLDLTPLGYAVMTKMLMSVCENIIVALEGGYNLDSLQRCSESVIKTLLGYNYPHKNLLNQFDENKDIIYKTKISSFDENFFIYNERILNELVNQRKEFAKKWKSLDGLLKTPQLTVNKVNNQNSLIFKELLNKLKLVKINEMTKELGNNHFIELKIGHSINGNKDNNILHSINHSHRIATYKKFGFYIQRLFTQKMLLNDSINCSYVDFCIMDFINFFKLHKLYIENLIKKLENILQVVKSMNTDLINFGFLIVFPNSCCDQEMNQIGQVDIFVDEHGYATKEKGNIFENGILSLIEILKEISEKDDVDSKYTVHKEKVEECIIY